MREIRSRISERHGIDLTHQQIQELAARRLEAILDPRTIKPSLMDELRRAAGLPADAAPCRARRRRDDRRSPRLYQSDSGFVRAHPAAAQSAPEAVVQSDGDCRGTQCPDAAGEGRGGARGGAATPADGVERAPLRDPPSSGHGHRPSGDRQSAPRAPRGVADGESRLQRAPRPWSRADAATVAAFESRSGSARNFIGRSDSSAEGRLPVERARRVRGFSRGGRRRRRRRRGRRSGQPRDIGPEEHQSRHGSGGEQSTRAAEGDEFGDVGDDDAASDDLTDDMSIASELAEQSTSPTPSSHRHRLLTKPLRRSRRNRFRSSRRRWSRCQPRRRVLRQARSSPSNASERGPPERS